MASWAKFAAAAPEMAAAGRQLLHQRGDGEALLATVRGDKPPRVHPINVGIVGGRLYGFIIRSSAKEADLVADGRYALRAHVDPDSPSEFMVRGRAAMAEGNVRGEVAAGWYFTVDDGYDLFEFGIEMAELGRRDTADDWPPIYSTWQQRG